MKVAILTTDNRGIFKEFHKSTPWFGPAPEAIIAGLAAMPEIELHIISCIRKRVEAPEKLADNIWFHSLTVPKIGWMRSLYFGCVRATRRKVQEINPDIVHGQGTEHENGISAACSGYPNVITLHGIMSEHAKLLKARPGSFYWLAHRLESFALRKTAGALCNSTYTEACVRPRARRTWRVPNPLREAFFQPPTTSSVSGQCVLLNIGYVGPLKRQCELLRAARELHQEGWRFQLQFLGKASGQDAYSRQFLELIEQNRNFATHLGFKSLPEIIKHLDAAAGLIHVSSQESFGLVVAEALARNLKLLGFRVGGVADIGAGVEGAELVEDGDWASLKSTWRNWIRAGAPRPTTAAKAMRERYHPTVVGRRHLEIYREVLGRA